MGCFVSARKSRFLSVDIQAFRFTKRPADKKRLRSAHGCQLARNLRVLMKDEPLKPSVKAAIPVSAFPVTRVAPPPIASH
jgi:hypothetical protein